VPLQDLVLMPESDARRALGDQPIALRVLAPVGGYAGCGKLRVLRVLVRQCQRPEVSKGHHDTGEMIELDCGYESYVRLHVGSA
jgi:hypothetical protein